MTYLPKTKAEYLETWRRDSRICSLNYRSLSAFTMSFVTTIVLILFGLYVANSVYVIYHLFHVPGCQGNSRKCLQPHGVIDKKLEVSLITLRFISLKK